MTEIVPADPKRRFLCRHIHTNGHRCGSPALRGHNFCYYHDRSHREYPIAGRTGIFAMQRIDDRAAIQMALFDVLGRLSAGDINYKLGGILLYGLQIASANLPRNPQPDASAAAQPKVEEIVSDRYLGDLAPIAEISTPEILPPEIPAPETLAFEIPALEIPAQSPHLTPEQCSLGHSPTLQLTTGA